MAKLQWDQSGERRFETGVDHGVLYVQKNGAYPKGVAWSGLTNITESPSGAEDNKQYADNMVYLNIKSIEEFGATVECFTYPDEWSACNGEAEPSPGIVLMQQRRNPFGLCYRTKIGNDTEGDDLGYKLHLIYNCSASPSEKSYQTTNDSPEAITFSYEITTTSIPIDGVDADGKPYRPVSSIIIDSTKVDKEKLASFEDILYGKDGESDGTEARLPLPSEVLTHFAAA